MTGTQCRMNALLEKFPRWDHDIHRIDVNTYSFKMDRHMVNKKMDYRGRRGGNKPNKVPSITGNPQDSDCFEENDSHGSAWSC